MHRPRRRRPAALGAEAVMGMAGVGGAEPAHAVVLISNQPCALENKDVRAQGNDCVCKMEVPSGWAVAAAS